MTGRLKLQKKYNFNFELFSRKPFILKKGLSGRRSEFGLQLFEKQKIKIYYCISEKQYKLYINSYKHKIKKYGASFLGIILEKRLDSFIYRTGFFSTRLFVKQTINHGFVLVNNVFITKPGYLLNLHDVVSFKNSCIKRLIHSVNLCTNYSWIRFSLRLFSFQLSDNPVLKELKLTFNFEIANEFYTK